MKTNPHFSHFPLGFLVLIIVQFRFYNVGKSIFRLVNLSNLFLHEQTGPLVARGNGWEKGTLNFYSEHECMKHTFTHHSILNNL